MDVAFARAQQQPTSSSSGANVHIYSYHAYAHAQQDASHHHLLHPPSTSLSFLKGVAFAALPYLMHGAIFYAFSQVSHIQHECFDELLAEEDAKEEEDEARGGDDDEEVDEPTTSTASSSSSTTTTTTTTAATSTARSSRSNSRSSKCSNSTAVGKTTATRRKGSLAHDWAAAQVAHTADYSCRSTLWLWLSNGLNHQTAHHLFPSVDWCHHKVPC
jgi:hypothetical protein